MLDNTDAPEILCVDLLKTDFWSDAAYPTYLLYNPLDEQRTVTLRAGGRIRWTCTTRFPENIWQWTRRGDIALRVPGDTAVQAVLIPSGLALVREGERLTAGGVTVTYRRGVADFPGLTEATVMTEDTEVSLSVELPEGDGVKWALVTYEGVTLFEGDTLPQAVTLSPRTLGAGRGVLKLMVETLSGDALSCYKGIGLADINPANVVLTMDGAGLYALAKPTDNCGFALTDEGMQCKLLWGGTSIDCPAVTAGASDRLFVFIKITSATGRWGLSCVVGGEEHYLRADSCAAGEFLCDLRPALEGLETEGEDTSLVVRVFANGTKDEVTIQRITIFKGGE